MVGLIIYTGPDPGARQTSTIFGGSDLVQQLLNDNRVDARKLLDRATTYLKWGYSLLISDVLTNVLLPLRRSAELQKQGAQLASIIGINVERRPGEGRRDRDRRVFTAIIHQCLSKWPLFILTLLLTHFETSLMMYLSRSCLGANSRSMRCPTICASRVGRRKSSRLEDVST